MTWYADHDPTNCHALTSKKGGRIQSIWAFDGLNSLIGKSDGGNLDDGAYDTFVIGQDNPAKLAEYISLGNSDDGTCISWIKVSQVDNSPGNVWTGDVGAACGQRWYMGGQSAGRLPNGDTYVPRCKSGAGIAAHQYPSTYGLDM